MRHHRYHRVTKHARSRGVALVVAVALLGMAAATVAAVAIALSNDFDRLRVERDQAQRQQYELASVAIAMDQLRADRLVNGILPLPADAGHATIAWESASPTAQTATVMLAGQQTRYAFSRRADGWKLAKAD
jgi:hypothetical protein